MQNSPSSGRSGLGMAVVFLEEVRRQYLCKWRAPDCMVYPAAGYVNSRIVERKDPQTPKRNSLPILNFLHVRHCVIEMSPANNHQKITMTAVNN
jgi:hypothetical protein